MHTPVVRIVGLDICDLKNVKHGLLKLEGTEPQHNASILGLYGQNGSGKTALIDALELLRLLLTGSPVPNYFADLVYVGSRYSKIQYTFEINGGDNEHVISVVYEVKISQEVNEETQNVDSQPDAESNHVVVFDEVLSCVQNIPEKRSRLHPVIDTGVDDNKVFIPVVQRDMIVGKEKSVLTDLIVAKHLTRATSRSFVFSREFLNIMRKNCANDMVRGVLESLVTYGNRQLFVINTTNTALISMDALPISFKYRDGDKEIVGSVLLKLNGASLIPEFALDTVKKVISSMNIVLQQLIPGLIIDLMILDSQILKNGNKGVNIQLMAKREQKEIPLKYESEGIRKLISVLQLLIVVYNKPSITVAIDELDSGIFEYLLGEILRVIAEQGKGQLIFTSHNLRPLETLDKRFIAFTTTNPENRYMRMAYVKSTNNLRNCYYHDLLLGGQSEPLYNSTNNSEIALAFREANHASEP